jgi:hypothetical protein
MSVTMDERDPVALADRTAELFAEQRQVRLARVDRMFAVLMLIQWLCAIAVALVYSPYGWAGKVKVIHLHVYIAVLMGGAITLLPVLLAKYKPGAVVTRHVIAVSQMLMSALLIHLTGGRIETHFHVFGSLAFLAFYLDWPVLVTATIVVAGDHFVRGVFWPESVYGITNPEWWRFLEHAFWVAQQAALEQLSEQEQLKSAALEMALSEFEARSAPA